MDSKRAIVHVACAILLFFGLGAFQGNLSAQPLEFPYKGIVTQNEAYVRSGNTRSFYPTDRLRRGDRVTVVRQDPGGWLMIEPPTGSFSWIAARYVRQLSQARGVVTANNVVVRVGSKFDDTHNAFQRRLSVGDEVEILGRKSLRMDERLTDMYKIKPPRGEHRWIRGQLVVPEHSPAGHGLIAEKSASKPLISSSKTLERVEQKPVERLQPASQQGVRRVGPANEEVGIDCDRLVELDRQLNAMLRQPKSSWQFSRLSSQYRALSQSTVHPAIANYADIRLASIARYEKLQREYQSQLNEVLKITSRAEQRDRELLEGRTTNSRSNGQAGPQRNNLKSATRQFSGAGIIGVTAGRSSRYPKHVLLAPNGRVLAYLISTHDVNLDQYVGRSMGFYGDRRFDARLRADLLNVKDLAPVRLKR